MKQRNFPIVVVLGMLLVVSTVTAVASIPQSVYAEEDEEGEKDGQEGEKDGQEGEKDGQEGEKDGQGGTSVEEEEDYECNISGVLNTCIIGEPTTGVVQATQDQTEVPMILALPT
jgi:hypothetical protein